jgi:hypothetical protein
VCVCVCVCVCHTRYGACLIESLLLLPIITSLPESKGFGRSAAAHNSTGNQGPALQAIARSAHHRRSTGNQQRALLDAGHWRFCGKHACSMQPRFRRAADSAPLQFALLQCRAPLDRPSMWVHCSMQRCAVLYSCVSLYSLIALACGNGLSGTKGRLGH